MVPETFPILVANDIIRPPAIEYKIGGKKSTVGWLKYLYLFAHEGEYLVITDKDRKDYVDAEKKFREVNRIAQSVDLHDWEEQHSQTQQSKALNKLRIHMGYVVPT